MDAKQPITKPFDGPCTVDVKLSNMVLDVNILEGPACEPAPNVELPQQPPPTPQVVHPAANPADPVRIIPQSAEEVSIQRQSLPLLHLIHSTIRPMVARPWEHPTP